MNKTKVDGHYPNEDIRQQVTFEKPYDVPPTMITWLTMVDINGQENVNRRVQSQCYDVTCTGFSMVITTWDATLLVSATAGWLAYASDAPGIAGGTVHSGFGGGKHRVDFQAGLFDHSPEVFLALKHIDIRSHTNAAVSAEVLDRRATHLSLSVGPLKCPEIGGSECEIDGLGVSYLAIA